MFCRLFYLPLVLAIVVAAQERTTQSGSTPRNRQGSKPAFKVTEKPKFVSDKLHQDFLAGLQRRRPPTPSPTVDPMVTATPFSVFDFFTRKNNPFKATPKTVIVHRFSPTTHNSGIESRPSVREFTPAPTLVKLDDDLPHVSSDPSTKFNPGLE